MNYMKRYLNKLFNKKQSTQDTSQHLLRNKVMEMYGKEFVELYDKVNQGVPIGGLYETVVFLNMIEKARESLKNNDYDTRTKRTLIQRSLCKIAVWG